MNHSNISFFVLRFQKPALFSIVVISFPLSSSMSDTIGCQKEKGSHILKYTDTDRRTHTKLYFKFNFVCIVGLNRYMHIFNSKYVDRSLLASQTEDT